MSGMSQVNRAFCMVESGARFPGEGATGVGQVDDPALFTDDPDFTLVTIGVGVRVRDLASIYPAWHHRITSGCVALDQQRSSRFC
jgi:hypothetical protein